MLKIQYGILYHFIRFSKSNFIYLVINSNFLLFKQINPINHKQLINFVITHNISELHFKTHNINQMQRSNNWTRINNYVG